MKEVNKITLLLKIGLIIMLFYMCRMQPHRTKQLLARYNNFHVLLQRN